MDNFIKVNMAQITRAVDTADVLVVGFTIFPERLMVDNRHDYHDPPMIKVVRPVSSVEERIAELRELRPRFPAPERFIFFVWPKRVATLVEMGIWRRITQRCLSSGHWDVSRQCEEALRELNKLESEEIFQAIKGQKYQSIWERKG